MNLFDLHIAFASRFWYISVQKRIESFWSIHFLLVQSQKGRYSLMKKLITYWNV